MFADINSMINKILFVSTVGLFICISLSFSFAQSAGDSKDSDTFKKARTYYFGGKYEMAELLLQEELRQNPENGIAYAYLGDIFLQKKQLDGALSLYKKAVELSTSNAENFYSMGAVYYYKQLPDLSIEYYKKALSTDANLKKSYYQIGLTNLMLVRDKKNTIENWETYLRLAPEDPQYEKIRRVIELLRDPNFELPPPGSDISIEEALHLGGAVLQKGEVKGDDKTAGHEGKKTVNKSEDIFRDDALQ
jgi:tetratricopeptide (TPR) repeat protein